MRTFAISDIHGCLDELDELLALINPTKKDTIIFLGDYIDRGPKSMEVIDYLIWLKDRVNCIFLKGNHEDMFLNCYINRLDPYLFLSNGGKETLKSYRIRAFEWNSLASIPESHMEFLRDLKLYYKDENYMYVHAGIRPENGTVQSEEDLLWIRSNFIYKDTHYKEKVIFGHTPFDDPLVMIDKIGIDTGCCFGGKLTAIELPQEKFYFVKGKK